ncbi:MAG: glycosyltransferase family 2 protein [Maricaulaceae bacterium]
MPANVVQFLLPEEKPRISVVMISYNTGPALLEAITAVIADPDIFELIIIDNGNSFAARQKLSDLCTEHDRIRLHQGHGNIGFAKGCNYGAEMARGSHFLFLNPDAILPIGSAMKLAECEQQYDMPSVIGGRLMDVNGKEQRGSRRSDLTPLSALISFSPLQKLPGFKSLHLENTPLPEKPIEIPVLSGACMMMSRASFETISGFNADYFLHVEDIELCRRVRQKGGVVVFHPHVEILHYGSTSLARRQDVEFNKYRGFYRYFMDYSGAWWGKALTLLAAPFMFFAIMGRAWYLVLRQAFAGH